MKKNKKHKEIDETIDNNYCSLPFTGSNITTHKYTPESYGKMMKSCSTIKLKESMRKFKHENQILKEELRKVQERSRSKQEEIKLLRNQVAGIKLDVTQEDELQEKGVNLYVTASSNSAAAREQLSRHFSEMMRRYHRVLDEKNQQIRSLKEVLARYENKEGSRERVRMRRAHPAVEAERVRRTDAALRELQSGLALARTQLEDKLPWTSEREKTVVAELRRRQSFYVFTDLEAMRRRFLQRLELEEKLDRLHWALESKRYKDAGAGCDVTCSHHQELLMLQTARTNLLRALRDLRADDPAQPAAAVSINTLQTIYRPAADTLTTDGSSEQPDK